MSIRGLSGIAERLRTGKAGRLLLAFVSSADYNVLLMLVQRYSEIFPDVELELTEATSDLQVAALLEGRINAGILISAPSALPSTLDYLPLVMEPLVAAVPEFWITDGRLTVVDNVIQNDDWMAQPLIIFPARVSPDFHSLVMDIYRARGCDPFVQQEAIQMQTIISLVSAGLGMALVPASMQQLARTGVRYVAISGEAPMLETGLAWRRTDSSPVLASLINISTTICKMD